MNWLYENSVVTADTIPVDAIGFVYKITHTPSNNFYIGKKQLSSRIKKKIGKRELQKIKEERAADKKSGRLPVTKVVFKDSDWETYYSSNDEIKKMVAEGLAREFVREILMFCNSKKSLSYYEVKYQFEYKVLECNNCYNNNILGKFYRRDV